MCVCVTLQKYVEESFVKRVAEALLEEYVRRVVNIFIAGIPQVCVSHTHTHTHIHHPHGLLSSLSSCPPTLIESSASFVCMSSVCVYTHRSQRSLFGAY